MGLLPTAPVPVGRSVSLRLRETTGMRMVPAPQLAPALLPSQVATLSPLRTGVLGPPHVQNGLMTKTGVVRMPVELAVTPQWDDLVSRPSPGDTIRNPMESVVFVPSDVRQLSHHVHDVRVCQSTENSHVLLGLPRERESSLRDACVPSIHRGSV